MDSICAALGYAEFKRLSGCKDVVAARCGSTNARIDFVLRKFGVEPPVLINDLSPRVHDVMQPNVVSVHAHTAIYDAIQLIEGRRLRGLPVVDDHNRCLGLLNAFKITHNLFPSREETTAARIVTASLADVARTLGAQLVCGELSNEEEQLFLVVAAMQRGTFATRLEKYTAEKRHLVIFVGDRPRTQLLAIQNRARAVVVTGGQPIGADVEIAAREAGVTLLSVPSDTATSVLMARGATRAGRMLETDFVAFQHDARLDEAKHRAADSSAFIFPVLDDHGALCGILSKSDFIKDIPRQLILVDHNELDQAVRGADQLPIIEILDHHRLGGITSATPVLFWNNPVGSTSTIVALSFQQHGIPIPPRIAGLLLAGLISDTLNLNSPTTTQTDRTLREKLARIAGVDADAFAQELFRVGSPLLTLSPQQAITADSKPYTEDGHRFLVAQIEELTLANFPARSEALLAELDAQRAVEKVLFTALLITDITTQSSLLLASGEDRFLSRIQHPRIAPNLWQLDGIVSRKKQLLPYLIECLGKMPPG